MTGKKKIIIALSTRGRDVAEAELIFENVKRLSKEGHVVVIDGGTNLEGFPLVEKMKKELGVNVLEGEGGIAKEQKVLAREAFKTAKKVGATHWIYSEADKDWRAIKEHAENVLSHPTADLLVATRPKRTWEYQSQSQRAIERAADTLLAVRTKLIRDQRGRIRVQDASSGVIGGKVEILPKAYEGAPEDPVKKWTGLFFVQSKLARLGYKVKYQPVSIPFYPPSHVAPERFKRSNQQAFKSLGFRFKQLRDNVKGMRAGIKVAKQELKKRRK